MTAPKPFDESTLRAAFEDIELPDGLESNWRNRVALATPDKGRKAARRLGPNTWFQWATNSWLRTFAVGIAATAAAGAVGIVAANRQPAPEPDPDQIETITNVPPSPPSPTVAQPAPPGVSASGSASSPPSAPGGPATVVGPAAGTGAPSAAPPNPPSPAPALGALADWPNATNTGVPAGTRTSSHAGDLVVTTPGALIADVRVSGVIYVRAPDVTLRRVIVDTVWQQAPRLRIEDSDLGGGQVAVRQEATGLTVQRSRFEPNGYPVTVSTGTTVVDCYLPGAGSRVLTNGNTAGLTVRHNNMEGAVEITDQNGPVNDVTIENNQLRFIWAPSGAASHDIRVLGNQFSRKLPDDTPVSGWNAGAAGNIWTGNVWSGTSEPAVP